MGTAESRTSLELKHKMKSSKEGDNCMSLSQYAIYQNAMARAEISRLAAAQLHLASPGHGDVESFAEQCFDSAVRNLQSGSTMERCTKSWKGLGRKMLK